MSAYSPKLVRVDATWICNLNCKHCQTAMFRGVDHPEDLSTDQMLSLFGQLAAVGTQNVGLLGGEPLARKDLEALLRRLRDLAIRTSVTTNGLLLPRHAGLLADLSFAVAVSFDGPDAASHDFIRGPRGFVRARRGLEALRAARGSRKTPAIGLSTVLHQGNVARATEFLDLAKELEVDYLIIASVHPVGNAVDHWDSLAVT
jgi:MoaA/NifB/PqqE/SkfB family radical SAM enzyme